MKVLLDIGKLKVLWNSDELGFFEKRKLQKISREQGSLHTLKAFRICVIMK